MVPAASASTSTVSAPVTARWLNSTSVWNAISGMNCPLQSGHEPPQPWAEPVFVTSAPITSTTNMPHALTTESHLRMRYIRLRRPRFFQSSPDLTTGCNHVQPTPAARLPEAKATDLPFRVYRAATDAEVYDPTSDTWSTTGSISAPAVSC